MSPRIMYLRTKSGDPVGCLAINVNPCTGAVKYQYSTVNAKQDSFDRTTARNLSSQRLACDPISVKLPSDRLTMYNITEAVMKNLSRRSNVPSRASKAALNWLKENQKA
jgi:hypothetical protein